MELKDLEQKIKTFNEQRNWDKDIEPQDLAKSIIIEAAELLEHFQWDASRSNKAKDMEEVGNELADVLIYAIRLAYTMNLDLEEITLKKIEQNGVKHPVKN